jgi:serine/threonine protein kinase
VRSLGGRRWEARWRPAEAVEGSCRVRVLGDSPEGDAVSEPIPCHPDDPLSFEDNGTSFDRPKEALADRYALEREIGAGGMAKVFLAHDLRHNRKVAHQGHGYGSRRIGPERFLKEIQP